MARQIADGLSAKGESTSFGKYGLGGQAKEQFTGDLDSITHGTTLAVGASATNKPPGADVGVVRVEAWTNSNAALQRYSEFVTGGLSLEWERVKTSGAWSAWRRVYTQASILGTVSQSGGVPTGAIIERGSNANGEYVKYADGTMECWVSRKLATYYSATELRLNQTFPIIFAAGTVPAINVSSDFFASDAGFAYTQPYHMSNSGERSQVEIRLVFANSVVNSGDGMRVSVHAIGRWF